MKPFGSYLGIQIPRALLSISLLLLLTQALFAASTISGYVYDKQRNPLPNIDVELLDDYHRMYMPGGRARTDGTGKYQFVGIPDGRYTVRVMALQYDLEDQERMLEVLTQNIRGGEGVGYFTADFYLAPKKGGMREAELAVIFAQDVPKEAEQAYKRALENFERDLANQGFQDLQTALRLYPEYYQALHRYGEELMRRKQYLDAASVYMRAGEVNPKSAMSFYYVGMALNYLGKDYNKAASRAMERARFLAPGSVQVLWLSGKIEREQGNLEEAEKHLLQAKKQSPRRVPEIHKELAQLYGNDLKKYDLAADELEQYLKASRLEKEDERKTKKLIDDLRKKASGAKQS